MAVFPVQAESAAKPIAEAIDATLARTLSQPPYNATVGAALGEALGRAASEVVASCGAKPDCIARAASAAGFEQALWGRVTRKKGSFRVRLEISGTTRSSKHVSFEVRSPRDAEARASAFIDELLQPTRDASDALALELVPIAPHTPEEGASSAAGKPTEIFAEPVAAPHAPAAPAALEPSRLSYWSYAGAGGGIFGLALFATGVVSGLEAQNTYARANARDATGQLELSAPRARQLKRQADAATLRANVLFGLGTTFIAAGAGLVAYDLWWRSAPRVEISAGPDALGGRLSWTF